MFVPLLLCPETRASYGQGSRLMHLVGSISLKADRLGKVTMIQAKQP